MKKHMSFGFYLWPLILIVLTGLIDSVYLSISHYKIYTDVWYQSFCAVTKSINCDSVSTSKYAVLLDIPVAIWGIYGYLFFSGLILLAFVKFRKQQKLWALVFSVSIMFCFSSICLALISNYYIHSYCIFCILSYIANFFACFYIFIILRRFSKKSFLKLVIEDISYLYNNKIKVMAFILLNIAIVLSLSYFFPRYWDLTIKNTQTLHNTGVSEQGYPWIGAANPEMEIYMFSDYQCFQCRKMHFYLRNILNEYPDKLRLVHINFPMDKAVNPVVKEDMHIGSGALAIMAKYALEKNKFWEVNDYFFHMRLDKGEIDLKMVAEDTGLNTKELALSLGNKKYYAALRKEIKYALSLEITGTPSYFVDGNKYFATMPDSVLRQLSRKTR